MAVSRTVLGVNPELSRQVVGLFRRICRDAPRMCAIYELPMAPADFRHQVNVLFREHRNVTEPRVIRILLQKGEMEFEECLEQWKQRSHVLTLLSTDLLKDERAAAPDEEVTDEDFLDRFLSLGRNAGPIKPRLKSTGPGAGHQSPLE